jgi:hypothetical protein
MRSIQDLERLAGPRKSKPKVFAPEENPKSYITNGIGMAIDHIINLDREKGQENHDEYISNSKNGPSS